MTEQGPVPSLVGAFAARVAELPPEAWDRIHTRCARLDGRTRDGVLNRIELYARSMPDSDPYQEPMMRPAMAMLGRVFGFAHELLQLSSRPRTQIFERMREMPLPANLKNPQDHRAIIDVELVAERYRTEHPGTASALRAVANGLSWQRKSLGPSFAALYQPFEPEIPLESLKPAA